MSWCVLSGFPVSPIWPLTSAERVIRTERYAGIDFRVSRTTSNLLDSAPASSYVRTNAGVLCRLTACQRSTLNGFADVRRWWWGTRFRLDPAVLMITILTVIDVVMQAYEEMLFFVSLIWRLIVLSRPTGHLKEEIILIFRCYLTLQSNLLFSISRSQWRVW